MTDSIIKVCPKHGDLIQDDIKVWKYKNKTYRRCKKCISEKNSRYQEKMRNNAEWVAKKKEKDNARWSANKQQITEKRRQPEALKLRKEWYQENKERLCPTYREKQINYRKSLHDTYIRKIIQAGDKSLKFSNIPQSLVDFKRTIMQAKKFLQAKTSQINYQKSKGGK